MATPKPFNQDTADKICEIISSEPIGLRAIAKQLGLSKKLILKWLKENEGFRTQYARAKKEQADLLAEECIEIADDDKGDAKPFVGMNRIQRARLRIDTRKWMAGKLNPKKYGEKLDITTDGEKITQPIGLIIEDAPTIKVSSEAKGGDQASLRQDD